MALSAPAIECDSLSKKFGKVCAIEKVSLQLEADSMGLLVGPSGAGKTTLLRLITGLDRPDSGRIALFGQEVASGSEYVPPENRGVGYLSQNPSLWPHLSVVKNVTAHTPRRGVSRREREERALSLLADLGIIDLKSRKLLFRLPSPMRTPMFVLPSEMRCAPIIPCQFNLFELRDRHSERLLNSVESGFARPFCRAGNLLNEISTIRIVVYPN